jgi:hypothetical protein
MGSGLGASAASLFSVYRRFNATARLRDWPMVVDEHPDVTRYFAPVRKWGRTGAVYTFEVAGATPWQTFSAWLQKVGGWLRTLGR